MFYTLVSGIFSFMAGELVIVCLLLTCRVDELLFFFSFFNNLFVSACCISTQEFSGQAILKDYDNIHLHFC